jgi:hypothetical protein
MKTKEEIKERISYIEQCIVKDVTEGIISVDALKYDRAVLETLRYVLDKENE